MSRCTLRLELDTPGPVAAGRALTGVVHVEVDAPVKCDSLSVELRWFANGDSRRKPERCRSVVAFEGHWPPGIHAVPFSIDVPSAPLSFHSREVRLEWDLTARADIPWSIDPTDVLLLEVVRDPENPRGRYDMGTPPVPVLPKVVASYLLGLLAIGLGGVATYVTGLLAWYGFQAIGFLTPVGLLFVGVGGWMIWSEVQDQRRRALLSVLDVQFSEPMHWPGDRVAATVTVASDDRLEVAEVSLTLRRKAWVVVRDHQNKVRTRGSWDDAETRIVWSDLSLERGQPASKSVQLLLPPDASPNTCLQSCGVRWCLDVEVRLAGSDQPIQRELNVPVA